MRAPQGDWRVTSDRIGKQDCCFQVPPFLSLDLATVHAKTEDGRSRPAQQGQPSKYQEPYEMFKHAIFTETLSSSVQ